MPTLSTAARDAACDAIVDLLDAGGAGDFRLGTTSMATILATITLNATAFGASSTGTAALDVTPALSAAAGDTGTAAEFQFRNNAGTVVINGTIGTGSEDLDIDNPSVSVGQTVNLNAATVTVPAS